jgi:hypothetical protein
MSNTPRYVRHFEEIADELLPPSTVHVGAGGGDIFDFLQVLDNTKCVPFCISLVVITLHCTAL